MSTIVTRSGKGSPHTHAEVDSNFTNLNTDKLELSGGTMTGDVGHGDNVKATFGASSDLQIYHDGNHSYISDQGTGRLYLRASNDLFISDAAGSKHKAVFTTNGAVSLRYDGDQKFATTSTGVDITGTLTSDGLTVEQSGVTTATISSTGDNATDLVFDTNRANANNALGRIWHRWNGNNAALIEGKAGDDTTNKDEGWLRFWTADAGNLRTRMDIDYNGDISFYEDTGTTPKFFWDASAESLGIGTTSPAGGIDATTASSDAYFFKG